MSAWQGKSKSWLGRVFAEPYLYAFTEVEAPALLMPHSHLECRLMDRVWKSNIFGEDLFNILDNWAATRYRSILRCTLPLLLTAISFHSELPFVSRGAAHLRLRIPSDSLAFSWHPLFCQSSGSAAVPLYQAVHMLQPPH